MSLYDVFRPFISVYLFGVILLSFARIIELIRYKYSWYTIRTMIGMTIIWPLFFGEIIEYYFGPTYDSKDEDDDTFDETEN